MTLEVCILFAQYKTNMVTINETKKVKKWKNKKTILQFYNFTIFEKRIKSGTLRGCHSLLMDRKKVLHAASNWRRSKYVPVVNLVITKFSRNFYQNLFCFWAKIRHPNNQQNCFLYWHKYRDGRQNASSFRANIVTGDGVRDATGWSTTTADKVLYAARGNTLTGDRVRDATRWYTSTADKVLNTTAEILSRPTEYFRNLCKHHYGRHSTRCYWMAHSNGRQSSQCDRMGYYDGRQSSQCYWMKYSNGRYST